MWRVGRLGVGVDKQIRRQVQLLQLSVKKSAKLWLTHHEGKYLVSRTERERGQGGRSHQNKAVLQTTRKSEVRRQLSTRTAKRTHVNEYRTRTTHRYATPVKMVDGEAEYESDNSGDENP